MKKQNVTASQTKKIVLTIIAGVCLACIYGMIFMFSADNGEDSSAISVKVTKWLISVYYELFGTVKSGEVITASTYAWEGFVRKLAHFIEYMSIGFLSAGIAVLWMKRTKIMFSVLIIQLFLSAGLDELHQYFVPGRNGSIKDVFLDVSGGIVGVAILFIIYNIKKHKMKRRCS